MAYSSFSKTDFKYGFLCYPSDQLEIKSIKYINAINEATNTILVLGIPLKKDSIIEAKQLLTRELNVIEKKTTLLNT
jgi:hypothetical protein